MRQFLRDGVRWSVREVDTSRIPGARGDTCLIFECDGVVRRVWDYAEAWARLSDEALWALVDAPALAGASIAEAARIVADKTRSLLAQLTAARQVNRTLRGDARDLLDRCETMRGCMHAAVAQYAKGLRAGGVPPERAVILMKSALSSGLAGSDDDAAEQLLHEAVDRGIDAYYAA
jgi:hypothetical protein